MQLPEMATDIVVNGQGFAFDEYDMAIELIIQLAAVHKKPIALSIFGDEQTGLSLAEARGLVREAFPEAA